MKSILIALSILLSGAAQAASTGTLIIQGTVAAITDVVVTPNTANNTSLNITAGETNKNVASVLETCNVPTGYKINIKSNNGSELRNLSDPTRKTTYQLSYGGGSMTTLTTSFQQVKNVTVLNASTTATSAVAVNVVALPTAVAGTYDDLVTIQIVGNP